MNKWENKVKVGLWLDFNFWDMNTLFNFAQYNFYNRLDVANASVNLMFKGPSRPVLLNDATLDIDNWTSTPTATNIDEYCLNVGHTLRVIDNNFRKNYNMKTCRQSWAKLIGNDYEMDKTCAFDPAQEGETWDSYFTFDIMQWLMVDIVDIDQADYDKLFPEYNWFLDNDFCTDFLDF